MNAPFMRYTLRRSTRARSLQISVQPDGAIVVVAPEFLGVTAIERFVMRYSDWARRKVKEASGRHVIRIARKDIPQLKKAARVLASERAAYFAHRFGVSVGSISIRAQKTRWGSCSHRGNLSFNYKIAALPPVLIDYIIVHEVCHLIELNHSMRFWGLVEREVPEHKRLRKTLRSIVFVFA